MDVFKAVETYVTKMVSTPDAIKVFLLDNHTVRPCFCLACLIYYSDSMQTPIVSLSSTQSTLLAHQVYLTDKIDNVKRERMPHLKCVCFLRPSEESISAVEDELREPKYGEYYLCQSVAYIHLLAPS